MKKIGIAMALAIVFVLTGCGSETSDGKDSSSEVSFEEKTSHLSEEAVTNLNDLPNEAKEALRVPTKFPSEPSLRVTANPPEGEIIMALTQYSGDEGKWNLMVHTYPNGGDEIGNEKESTEKIELDNGAEVTYHTDEGENIHFILWREESGVSHMIQLMQNYENPQDEVTKDEFIEIVTSMK
ncbi:hypothetical protein ACFOGI_14525 [Virgibacillus xinjiangensis]|uniref:DUF4367 domain-containing protein n=1 Tax=Virgibacillus xinjiangensis TaxID=393090 RepID=A0ABV7CZQ7_9BACI